MRRFAGWVYSGVASRVLPGPVTHDVTPGSQILKWMLAGWLVAACGGAWAQEAGALRLGFEEEPQTGVGGIVVSEGVVMVEGRVGQAAQIMRGARLACAAPGFLTEGFEITLWVRHDRPMADMHFEELVYLFHETADEKNRIMLQKRSGTDYILLAMSDGTGRAKGATFAGNWFAMKTGALKWEAGTWHELRITASRGRGEAALWVDGEKVASAKGTELPQALGDRVWIGSLKGRSEALCAIDELAICPEKEVAP